MILEELQKKTYVYYEKGMKFWNFVIVLLMLNLSYCGYVEEGYLSWHFYPLIFLSVMMWLYDTKDRFVIERKTGFIKLYKITNAKNKEYLIACRDVDELAIIVSDFVKEEEEYKIEFVNVVIF